METMNPSENETIDTKENAHQQEEIGVLTIVPALKFFKFLCEQIPIKLSNELPELPGLPNSNSN